MNTAVKAKILSMAWTQQVADGEGRAEGNCNDSSNAPRIACQTGCLLLLWSYCVEHCVESPPLCRRMSAPFHPTRSADPRIRTLIKAVHRERQTMMFSSCLSRRLSGEERWPAKVAIRPQPRPPQTVRPGWPKKGRKPKVGLNPKVSTPNGRVRQMEGQCPSFNLE